MEMRLKMLTAPMMLINVAASSGSDADIGGVIDQVHHDDLRAEEKKQERQHDQPHADVF